MIKVIASDMDGTLLGSDHKIAKETLDAIYRACDKGIRFIIATGRNYQGAMRELEDVDIVCDYILGSGAEVRNSDKRIVSQIKIDMSLCEEIYNILKKYPVSSIFNNDRYDYRIGTEEEIEESLINQIKSFHSCADTKEVKKTKIYQRTKKITKVIGNFEELKKEAVPIFKIFIFSDNIAMLDEIDNELKAVRDIAVASSFRTNLEITNAAAQKGPVLKSYIEELGYTMDEVMALGDSMNDYSMLSMDFGATIAMENAIEEIKKAAKYITKSNDELGVAYAIEELLKSQY